jgi:hypothetical protein
MEERRQETGSWKRVNSALVPLWLALIIAGGAAAQQTSTVGSVASVDGVVEIQHEGEWHAATVGAAVSPTDTVRTGTSGRLRIVFAAQSVLLIATDSEIIVEEASSEPLRAHLRLMRGKVRALVDDAFTAASALYEIETPIAVATVRGTDFIIVFDPVAEVQMPAAGSGRTDVVGIDGRVEVHSILDRLDHGVFVTAYELAVVERGQMPAPPQRLDETLFKQYLEGLEFIGGGRSESAARKNGLASGAMVLDADRADAVAGSPASAGLTLAHPAAPGEGGEGGAGGADDRAPVTSQPPRGSVLGGAGLDVDF